MSFLTALTRASLLILLTYSQETAFSQGVQPTCAGLIDKAQKEFKTLTLEKLGQALTQIAEVASFCAKEADAATKNADAAAKNNSVLSSNQAAAEKFLADLKICQIKLARADDFIGRYLASLSGPGARLVVTDARYGDLLNEERDKARFKATQDWRLRHGKPALGPYALRHTCEATWFFTKACLTDADSDNKSVTHCFVTRTDLTALTKGTDFCGFDPSPQGDKYIEVTFTCPTDGKPKVAKVRGDSKSIQLICGYPPPTKSALEKEIEFYTSAPCAVALPRKAS